jgi:hypothetical protein
VHGQCNIEARRPQQYVNCNSCLKPLLRPQAGLLRACLAIILHPSRVSIYPLHPLSNEILYFKFDLGNYVHGMWSLSLTGDIAWQSVSRDTSQGQPQNDLSWSWAYASDGVLEWPKLTLVGNYHTVHVCIKNEWALSVSGTLLPISVQAYEEELFPKGRNCNVIEHRRRHSDHQLQTIFWKGSLVQNVPGCDGPGRLRHIPKSEREKALETESRRRDNKYCNGSGLVCTTL